MAQTLKAAVPTHLKPGSNNGDDESFARKHHGKTRSHMVSRASCTVRRLCYPTRFPWTSNPWPHAREDSLAAPRLLQPDLGRRRRAGRSKAVVLNSAATVLELPGWLWNRSPAMVW